MACKKQLSRRSFVKGAAAGIVTLSGVTAFSCSNHSTSPTDANNMNKIPVGDSDPNGGHPSPGSSASAADQVPKRVLGKSGLEVSMLAFGGGSQFMLNKNGKWEELLQRSLDVGVNYFDTSYSYNGSEERYSEILTPIRDKVIMTTKFDGKKNGKRDVDAMMHELETSLTRLKTDYIDIFFIHAVDNNDSVTQIEDSVYAKMVDLKSQGVIRNLAFSSMNSASKSREMLIKLDFDVVMLAMNATNYGNYAKIALPIARDKNVGVMSMKLMRNVVNEVGTPSELIHYGLDQDGVAGAVIGHYGIDKLEQNADIVKTFKPSRVSYAYKKLEERGRYFAGPHALCWARPDYKDAVYA